MSRSQLHQVVKFNRAMLINAGSLVGTTLVTSGFGFIYWWLAARLFPPRFVGVASAEISVMLLLGTLSVVGLNTLLIGELPRQTGREGSLISAALLLTAGIGAGTGALFALIAPLLSASFGPLAANVGSVLLFALGVSLTSVALVLDQALIGLLWGGLQLWRNMFFSLVKLCALFLVSLWLAHATGMAIYNTWTLGNAFSLLALAAIALGQKKWPHGMAHPQWGLLHKLGPAALRHHALNLALLAPSQLLPVMITVLLSATANAWFYIAMGIATIILTFSSALTTVLYAEGALRPDMLRQKFRLSLSIAFGVSVVACAVLCSASAQILGLFGHSYATGAVWCLRILALESFPVIIRNHYTAIRRIEGRMGQAMLPIIIIGGLQLVGAALGARIAGVNGLCLGWLVVDCVGALFLLPPVYQAVKTQHVVEVEQAGLLAEPPVRAIDDLTDTELLVRVLEER